MKLQPPSLGLRGQMASAMHILLRVSTIFMAWKALSILAGSTTPVVCVISESMAPAFHRGDIIFLSNRTAAVEVGDIPVIWFEGNPLPMVHRIVQVFWDEQSE